MGMRGQSNVIFLVDFGLSKQYRDANTYEHIPCKTNLGLTGTTTFASINSHLGMELGRRDNLESLTYILIYFLHGSLPWQHLSGPQSVLKHKQQTKPGKLCCGLPAEFATFLEYSHSLSFKEIPGYQYICDLFKGLSSWEGLKGGMVFDWDRANDVHPQDQVSDVPHETPIVQWVHRQPPKRCEGYVLFFLDIICVMLMSSYSRLCQGVALTAALMQTF